MQLTYADRVLQTTFSEGVGDLALVAAPPGYRSILASEIGAETECRVCIDQPGAPDFEICRATVSAAGVLHRVSTLVSSNGNAAVAFGPGEKRVMVVLSAEDIVTHGGDGSFDGYVSAAAGGYFQGELAPAAGTWVEAGTAAGAGFLRAITRGTDALVDMLYEAASHLWHVSAGAVMTLSAASLLLAVPLAATTASFSGTVAPSADIQWANNTGFGLMGADGVRFVSYTTAGGAKVGVSGTSQLAITAGLAAFTVNALTTTGTFGVAGDVTVNVNKFVVSAATGAVSAASTITASVSGSAFLATTATDTTTYGRVINNSGGTPHTLHYGVYDSGTQAGGGFVGTFSAHPFLVTTSNAPRLIIAGDGSLTTFYTPLAITGAFTGATTGAFSGALTALGTITAGNGTTNTAIQQNGLSATEFYQTAGSAGVVFSLVSNVAYLKTTTAHSLVIGTNDTANLTITSGGASQFSSTLGVTGDFSVNINKATIAAATGNTGIAGTLNVAGQATFALPVAVTAANVAGARTIELQNTNIGTAGRSTLILSNDKGAGTGAMYLNMFSFGYTPSGTNFANGGAIIVDSPGGLSVGATHVNGPLRLYAANTLAATFTGADLTVVGFMKAGGAVTTTGTAATNIASSTAIDFSGGFGRLLAWGPNATTNAGIKVYTLRSDGSNSLNPLTISAAGALDVSYDFSVNVNKVVVTAATGSIATAGNITLSAATGPFVRLSRGAGNRFDFAAETATEFFLRAQDGGTGSFTGFSSFSITSPLAIDGALTGVTTYSGSGKMTVSLATTGTDLCSFESFATAAAANSIRRIRVGYYGGGTDYQGIELFGGLGPAGSHLAGIGSYDGTGTATTAITFTGAVVTMPNLAGAGTRTVVVDTNGVLSAP